VDEKVGELIRSTRSIDGTEERILRPDWTAVDESVRKAKLSRGPADVAAFYDFHNLQIAFDHVWEDARTEGYIERAKAMYRAIEDGGGDPNAALTKSTNPFRGLANELNIVRQAHRRFSAPASTGNQSSVGVMYARRPDNTIADAREGIVEPSEPDIVVDPLPPQDPHEPGPNGPCNCDAVEPESVTTAHPGWEDYPFTVFADKSVNFGLMVTYRQRWEPISYQVGRLVGTLTLAPKETISITTKQVVKTSFNRKQIQSNQQMRKEDAEDTLRDEAEIVARAQSKTNFALTAEGGYDLGPLGEGTFTSSFGKEAESSSQETKKAFRQAVRKSAQEYKDERRLEIESGQTTEAETTEKRDITNPNDELALTCIFYELQRRYMVSESISRVVPVILVGQYVPRPEEINEEWIRRHDWIIRRFLPDDSFRPALDYIARSSGDMILLNQLMDHMNSIKSVVNGLKNEIISVRQTAAAQYEYVQDYVDKRAAIEREEAGEGTFESTWEWAAGSDDESREAIRILEDAARERYDKAVQEEKDLRVRLERETTALQIATESYTKAYAEYRNQRTQIDRLIQHLKSDILRYMHGIWSYEHPDQRFFRHHTILAPRLEPLSRNYKLRELDDWPAGVTPKPDKKCYEVTFTVEVDGDLDDDNKYGTLAELADLDRPLGFKGNYIIFPLKKSNALTDFMLTPYLDAEIGLRDPDGLGNWTLQRFSQYVQCLREALGDRFSDVEKDLRRQYQELLAAPLRDGEEITVPTKSLYMQLLVDSGKALEEFKEHHRKLDVEKVRAEVNSVKLNNLRKAKMILEDKTEDPDIESVKNVYYRGDVPPHDGDE
jgi:hypothetical protein